MLIDAPSFSDFVPGSVWLVGAGPGDPGLLTLLALQALRQADAIVYDALVDERVMQLAGPNAALEFAGKRGGKPSPSQHDISERLIKLARHGNRVLRLKGGDPFVFGRGGEEAMALRSAGIPFKIVPGITAGLGGLAYAGIPATTRATNQAVILAAGHYAAGSEDSLDWSALARTGAPIILYMAMLNLPGIVKALIDSGGKPDTPVAVVSRATTDSQRVLISTLARVTEDVADGQFSAPAIVAIGSIVALRDLVLPSASFESRHHESV